MFSNFNDQHIQQVEKAAVVAGRADTLQQLARLLSHVKETEGRRLASNSNGTNQKRNLEMVDTMYSSIRSRSQQPRIKEKMEDDYNIHQRD